MITYDHDARHVFGIPFFTLGVGVVLLGSLAALLFGVSRWKRPAGKIVVIGSSIVLLLFALAVVLVLVTVASGSMG